MPPRKRRFVALTCEENEIEDTLETYWPDYVLTNLAAYGGIGFGIKAQVVLVLTLREDATRNGSKELHKLASV